MPPSSSIRQNAAKPLMADFNDNAQEKKVTIVSDPLFSGHGPTRPVTLLATALKKEGYSVAIMAPAVSRSAVEKFEGSGIDVTDLNFKYLLRGESAMMFETWVHETLLRHKPRETSESAGLILNFSSTLSIASDVWYVQGPVLITVTFDGIYDELPWQFRVPYRVLRSFFAFMDHKFVNSTAHASQTMYANSGYTEDLFESLGFKMSGVIFPPVDTDKFRPSTNSPSEDYVLTYFGKETKYSSIKKIADSGVHIKAFGGKVQPLLQGVLTHRNIEFLNEVDDNQLVDLYSNALFTLFPFTNEPFGYIPVESMACSTPVLSFKRQGPAETIIESETGWLVENDHEIVKSAKKLWKQKYNSDMRNLCRKHAKKNFDQSVFIGKFLVILQNARQAE